MTGIFSLNTAGLPSLVDAQGSTDDNDPTDALEDSSRTVTLGSGNSKVKLTTVAVGSAADAEHVTVALVDPAGASAALSVTVSGNAITVHLATDSGSVITSTASQVIAAINGNGPASALVVAANGAGSNGSGVVVPVAATAVTAVAPITVTDPALQAVLRAQTFENVPVWIES